MEQEPIFGSLPSKIVVTDKIWLKVTADSACLFTCSLKPQWAFTPERQLRLWRPLPHCQLPPLNVFYYYFVSVCAM